MKKRHLVFLMGYKRTGKNTVGRLINDLSYGNFHEVGFADELKRQYWSSLGMSWDRDNEDDELKEEHRPGIINYGESMKHEKGMYHWIETALDPFIFDKDDNKSIIVTDCRRTEEVKWMKDFMLKRHPKYAFVYDRIDPHFIAVRRPDAEKNDSDYLTHLAIKMATEEMMMINRLIKNYGSLDDLKVVIEELYACRFK